MKSLDEIKKGLECCCDLMGVMCPYCPYAEDGDASETCREEMADDALALIQQLEEHLREATKKIEKLEAERDALMHWAKGRCDTCAHNDDCVKHDPDPEGYIVHWYDDCEIWEWRGVQKEE